MGRIWLMTTWLCATAMVSWLTFQALDAADAVVRDSPRTAVVVGLIPSAQAAALDTAATTTAEALPVETPPASVVVTPTTTMASTTPPSNASSENVSPPPTSPPATSPPATTPPTTSAPTPKPTPTTTTTMAPTTTTTAQQSWTTTTIPSPGGSLTVSYRPGEVRYEAAVPAAGYELEIDSISSDNIEVEFEDDEGNGWEIQARWNDGAFETEVDEL